MWGHEYAITSLLENAVSWKVNEGGRQSETTLNLPTSTATRHVCLGRRPSSAVYHFGARVITLDLLQGRKKLVKRPITVSKETNYSVKGDLSQCQKRPIIVRWTMYVVREEGVRSNCLKHASKRLVPRGCRESGGREGGKERKCVCEREETGLSILLPCAQPLHTRRPRTRKHCS